MASMKRPTSTFLLLLTDNPSRIAHLKKIKHDLTGHVSRKADALNNGLIPLIADLLQSSQNNDQVYSHAAQILALLAHEGLHFAYPLLDTNILLILISYLHTSPPLKTTLTVLRALVAIAQHIPLHLATLLYADAHIHCFTSILDAASTELVSHQACDAALTLLCKTLTLEQHKRALVDSGLLASICTRLASFVVAQGLVPPPPSPEAIHHQIQSSQDLPEPAPSFAHLSPVLESLSILIQGSKSRAKLFLANPAFELALPILRDDFSPSDIRRGPWGINYFSGTAVPQVLVTSPFDSLLPFVPVSNKNNHAGFPPLSSVQPVPKRRTSFIPASTPELPQLPLGQVVSEDEQEPSLIPWLLYTLRESRGKRRLLAAKLLVHLYSLNLVKQFRTATFASLVVPLLVRMLEAGYARMDDSPHSTGSLLCSGLHYTRAVPAVLAMLIMDDPEMQRVAVEGKAIASLATGLRLSFETLTTDTAGHWHPRQSHTADTKPPQWPGKTVRLNDLASCVMRQEMEFRTGCLQAIGAIAPFNDDYRKEICDQGALKYIMSALEPYEVQTASDGKFALYGNSAAVVLAACGAVRVLTRSVQALRTKLVEAEVAKPIIQLMSSSDPEVRIAATMVLANLAIDFSPMKDGVSESTVVKKLCEQAHSASARLRLESLWALKQLVLNANKKLKQEVVDELGSSWMKLLIKTDPVDIPDGEVIGLVERDYPPLNVYRTPTAQRSTNSSDIIMGHDSDTEPDVAIESDHSSSDLIGSLSVRHTVEDDLEIQAQLLDLLRNLFCGENASDLVRYILDEMGSEDFFKIMLDRLRPRTQPGPTRKENYTAPAPTVIVTRVLYIIVHVAACEPRWRNVIAYNHALMKQILTFTSHTDREIRAQCCWIAINLTYEDDASDGLACRHRALELQKVGFVLSLRKLEGDPDLNVRERAKSAIHLMTKLIAS
ncbi:hypothetical protein LTR84_010143 [Exophiala bonariae]|uniref:Armadillo repeat-containing protein 8 n=1 Tax=Exophiala bonariae TaxID=1690606 RepID=A0AAV9MXB6_9EURO|nr:hypothetical protein LTR84_010143 [Exophiala bonariae]